MLALKWCLWEEGEKENKVGMEFGGFGHALKVMQEMKIMLITGMCVVLRVCDDITDKVSQGSIRKIKRNIFGKILLDN